MTDRLPAPAPAIIYDAVRLFLGASVRTPRGVDRVDYDYARNLAQTWPGELYALLPTPWGLRLFSRKRTIAALDFLEAHWRESGDAGDDSGLRDVRQRLAGQQTAPRAKRQGLGFLHLLWRQLGMLWATGPALGRAARRTAPRAAIYLNIGQLGYAAPFTARWLRHRPDMHAVFLVHDVIPLEYPEYVTKAGQHSAKIMLHLTRRHATALILSTDAAYISVLQALRRTPPPAALTLPLPISPVFLEPDAPDPSLAAHRYFIFCSAIDPRKNHLLLLDVWRDLHARMGPATPKLLLVGAVSIGGKQIEHALLNCGELRPYIILVSGLSSPALRRLIRNARAMLFPSRAEGFGLPAIEALTLDTPAVLSDLPALREAAGGRGIYLSPDGRKAWADTVHQLATNDAALAALREDIAGFHPMTAEAYFETVQDFLLNLPARPA